MRYPVKLEKDGTGYFVSFPDIPEALTQGDSKEEALAMALDALVTAFEFYLEDDQAVPPPGEITCEFVEVPASVVAKLLLLNAYLESGLTKVELASRMGITKQEITRVFNLKHATKIDTIQKALSALGKRLELLIE